MFGMNDTVQVVLPLSIGLQQLHEDILAYPPPPRMEAAFENV
jgi:hypothetical protein